MQRRKLNGANWKTVENRRDAWKNQGVFRENKTTQVVAKNPRFVTTTGEDDYFDGRWFYDGVLVNWYVYH